MLTVAKPVPIASHPVGAPWPFADAAKHLNISLRTLIRLADAGRIRSIRFGRRRLIPAQELERIASEGCN
jgi:excisionase family DNA binding protein